MNLLIDLAPTSVDINGEKYEINSDFRTSILFELLTLDKSIQHNDKIRLALDLYYPVRPKDTVLAIEKILWFYRGGKDAVKPKRSVKGGNRSSTQVYSFEHDDDYIYAAFMDQYGIDLQDIDELHWWKFKALFKSLKEDNEIVKIMKYRGTDLSTIKDKEQKAYYKKMQEIYKIPLPQDEQEKLDEITNALLNGNDISKFL